MSVPIYVLTVNGTAVPLLLGFTINETVNGRNRLTCQVYAHDGTPHAPLGASVRLTEDGVTIFGGFIDAPLEAGVGGQPIIPTATQLSASDYSSLPERRIVGSLTLPAGTVKSWLEAIIPILSIYGTTLDQAIDGPTLASLSVFFVRLDGLLNQISDLTASTGTPLVWEIDYDNKLRMKQPALTPAPFDVIDGDRHALGDVTVEPSQEDFANRVHLLAGDGLHDVQDSFVPDGVTATYSLGYQVSATRGYVQNGYAGGVPVNETLGTSGAMWTIDLTASPQTITRFAPPAPPGPVVINYTAQFPIYHTADAPGGVTTPPGLWEVLVREPDVFDHATAQALAESYAAQYGLRPRTVRYRTQQVGIHPGQTQHIIVAARHANVSCMVTDVNITNQTGTKADREVTAVEGSSFLGSWRDMIRGWNSDATGVSGSRAVITGGGGGAAIGPGTPNYLAMWLTSGTIGDSLLWQSGSSVHVDGSLVATSFTGSGAGLTSVPSSALTGTLPIGTLPAFTGDVATIGSGTNVLTIQPGVITNAMISPTAAIA